MHSFHCVPGHVVKGKKFQLDDHVYIKCSNSVVSFTDMHGTIAVILGEIAGFKDCKKLVKKTRCAALSLPRLMGVFSISDKTVKTKVTFQSFRYGPVSH